MDDDDLMGFAHLLPLGEDIDEAAFKLTLGDFAIGDTQDDDELGFLDMLEAPLDVGETVPAEQDDHTYINNSAAKGPPARTPARPAAEETYTDVGVVAPVSVSPGPTKTRTKTGKLVSVSANAPFWHPDISRNDAKDILLRNCTEVCSCWFLARFLSALDRPQAAHSWLSRRATFLSATRARPMPSPCPCTPRGRCATTS
jgi:hypothetical protein